MSKKDYFSVGKILGTRGINGELKIEAWTDSLEDFCNIKRIFLDLNSEPLKIKNIRFHKNNILFKINDIESRNDAEKLIGKTLFAYREDISIPENRYFIEDLKGCEIIDDSNLKIYGILKDVINRGASDIYVVTDNINKKEYLLPIIPGTIKKIKIDTKKIYINPIHGVFDDN